MPLLHETQTVIGNKWEHCDSRSLVLDRFADSTLKGDERREFFRRSIGKRSEPHKRDAWREFLRTGLGLKPDDLLFAQLQARLMVNMAGGVMENAGLCLDRLTGIPYIPGSAVKGCARRMAIQELYESGAGFQPASDPEDLAAKSKRWDKCAQRLVTIARVFGWADQDWKLGSDFEYACGKADWEEIRARTVKLLFGANPNWKKPTGNQPLWKALPNFAGSVNFLPSYPVDLGKTGKVDGLPLLVPELGKLELDVVTTHHHEYYSGNPQFATAPDIEEPVPVVFPTVAPGHVFTFAVLPGRRCDETLLTAARNWLKQGLETFGLGAKVAAGYGWFDASDELQKNVQKAWIEKERQRQEEQKRKAEEEKRKAEEEARQRKAAEAKAATAGMTAEQKVDYKLANLTDDQFRGRLDNFTKRDPDDQKAIVRALRLTADQPGSRRAFWDALKARAQKGGKPAQIEQAIRQLSKQMFPGKEGKMP